MNYNKMPPPPPLPPPPPQKEEGPLCYVGLISLLLPSSSFSCLFFRPNDFLAHKREEKGGRGGGKGGGGVRKEEKLFSHCSFAGQKK